MFWHPSVAKIMSKLEPTYSAERFHTWLKPHLIQIACSHKQSPAVHYLIRLSMSSLVHCGQSTIQNLQKLLKRRKASGTAYHIASYHSLCAAWIWLNHPENSTWGRLTGTSAEPQAQKPFSYSRAQIPWSTVAKAHQRNQTKSTYKSGPGN